MPQNQYFYLKGGFIRMLPMVEKLVDQIFAAIREEAKKIPWFNEQPNGTIMVCVAHKSSDAKDWLLTSGPKDISFLPEGEVCATFYTPVTPGGDYVVTFLDGDVVDTKDYALKKIWHCHVALKNGFGYVSGLELPLQGLDEENGYGPYRGAIAFKVDSGFTNFCTVYVCVSGAKQMEDEQCALAAVPVVESFFEDFKDSCYHVEEPEIPE